MIRLVTSMFLHGGLMHLAMNVYGLLFAGMFLEPMLGSGRFASAYLITGTIGSMASAIFHDATVSVGASGAIFGLYGVLIVLMLRRKSDVPTAGNSLLISVLIFVGFNLFMGSIVGGIDNAAHLGGLVSGMLFGAMQVLVPKPMRRRQTRGRT